MWGFQLRSVVSEHHALIVTEREYPGNAHGGRPSQHESSQHMICFDVVFALFVLFMQLFTLLLLGRRVLNSRPREMK